MIDWHTTNLTHQQFYFFMFLVLKHMLNWNCEMCIKYEAMFMSYFGLSFLTGCGWPDLDFELHFNSQPCPANSALINLPCPSPVNLVNIQSQFNLERDKNKKTIKFILTSEHLHTHTHTPTHPHPYTHPHTHIFVTKVSKQLKPLAN